MPSRGISGLRVSLDEFLILDRYSLLGAQGSGGFTTPCLFILGGGYGVLGLLTALLKYRR